MKQIYSKYSGDDLWSISQEDFIPSLQGIRESQFSLGNGLMGTRGVLEEIPHGAHPGTYLAGVYDKMTSQVAEMVNFPNPFNFKFTVNGEKLGAGAMDILEHKRTLNMRDGLLLRKTVYSDSKKRRYHYQSLRFVSMKDKNVGVMRIILTPLDADAAIELQTSIDTSVYNIGVVTEGHKRHFKTREIANERNSRYLAVETLEKSCVATFRCGFHSIIEGKKVYAPDNVLSLKFKKGQSAVFTKIFHISHCDNNKEAFEKNKQLSKSQFQKTFRKRFTHLITQHIEQWHKLWDAADIAIEGAADIQKNVRFNIYHMIICAPDDNGVSSIGARTLSGEGYRGHIFWDTEIFLLPFYSYIMPSAAKNMLLYRYHRLSHAKKIAKDKGFQGTMFPWESAATGEDETPTWAKDLDGTIIKIKTNNLEHHITADIAYAAQQYHMLTGDNEFLRNYGYEIIFEAARFWASRVQRNKNRHYEIRDIIGPDEFHEHVNNNAFTNMMAKWNLLMAYQMFQETKTKKGEKHQQLAKKMGLSQKEVNRWKHIAAWIKINVRRDKIIEQFDGFFRKTKIVLDRFDENSIPLLPKGIKVKDYNTTQLVKQADVVMLLYLVPYAFDQETKKRNFRYYADRTLHKSSLSPSTHAIVALEAGALTQAYQFFNVSLRADISNMHGNTADGIHAASLGGTWQAVINGFGGVKIQGNMPSINPRLPKTWQKIKFAVFWRGDLIRIETDNDKMSVHIESKQRKNVRIALFGKGHLVRTNKKTGFLRGKIAQGSIGYY